jgi:hypothetical protein
VMIIGAFVVPPTWSWFPGAVGAFIYLIFLKIPELDNNDRVRQH